MSRATILALVTDMLAHGAARIIDGQRDRAIDNALVRYTNDRPRTMVEDVASTGGRTLPLPTSWEADISTLRTIETPLDQMPPAELETGAWSTYRGPAGTEIRLADALPAGQVARLTFTVMHVLTDTACSIPALHFEAFASLAAAMLCDQLATACADNMDPTIGADRVDHTSPAREWSARARSYRTRYFATLGIRSSQGQEDARPEPAGVVVDLDLAPSFGKPFLYPRGAR